MNKKMSKVCPILKKMLKNIPKDYRLISTVPIFSKLLEVLDDYLLNYLEHNNILNGLLLWK